MRTIRTLAIVILCALPSIATAASYSYSEAFTVTGTNPVRMTAREFTFVVQPGQLVEGRVDFTATAGDVDLVLVPPGGSCTVPLTDVITASDCALYTVNGRTGNPTCADSPSRHPARVGSAGYDVEEARATAAGSWRAVVMFPSGVLQTRYTLTLSVDGQAPSVSGPVTGNWVIGNPACRLPETP